MLPSVGWSTAAHSSLGASNPQFRHVEVVVVVATMRTPTTASDIAFSRGRHEGESAGRRRIPAHHQPGFRKDYSPSRANLGFEMATDQRRFGVGPRELAGVSVVAVTFGILAVVFGGPAVTTVGVLAVMASAVALLLAVGQYLGD